MSRVLGAVTTLKYAETNTNPDDSSLEISQLVTLDENGDAVKAGANTGTPIFPLYTRAREGSNVDVQAAFIADVITGGEVSVGDLITSDANSKGIATTTSGDYVLGPALQPASAADQRIQVLMVPRVLA